MAGADAVRRKREVLESGRGPVLWDTITYRCAGHSPWDASSYRTKDEVALWEEVDSITTFADLLVSKRVLKKGDVDDMFAKVADKLGHVLTLAIDEDACPRVDAQFIESVMLSNGNEPTMDADREPELLTSLEENPRVQAIGKKVRTATDADRLENQVRHD